MFEQVIFLSYDNSILYLEINACITEGNRNSFY